MTAITIPQQGKFSNLQQAARLAHELMDDFGLDGWTFRWDRAKERLGQCSRRKRTISLSAPLTSLLPFRETEDTIRHEIAHAISRGHHGAEWKAACRKTGARPVRCGGSFPDADKYLARYKLTCPEGHVFYRHRQGRYGENRRSCPRCNPRKFDERFLLRWELNPDMAC